MDPHACPSTSSICNVLNLYGYQALIGMCESNAELNEIGRAVRKSSMITMLMKGIEE
jgi:hypothetical protein